MLNKRRFLSVNIWLPSGLISGF